MMNGIHIHHNSHTLTVTGVKPPIDLARSTFCGQAFRWKIAGANKYTCVLQNKVVTALQLTDGIEVSPVSESEIPFFINYFDLKRDYAAIEDLIASIDEIRDSIECASGIRIFNQEPFETLISFIISANNNIKRISSTVDRLCRAAGDEIASGMYSFPTPTRLVALGVDELRRIGTGYRAPYIAQTAEAIAGGFSLDELKTLSYAAAKKRLMTLKGVGEKVADCVLLFSLGHSEAFPADVWIKRAMSELFFDGKDMDSEQKKQLTARFGDNAGIVQQYIFHYIRQLHAKNTITA